MSDNKLIGARSRLSHQVISLFNYGKTMYAKWHTLLF